MVLGIKICMYTWIDFSLVLINFSLLLVKGLVHVVQSNPTEKNSPNDLVIMAQS